ncbi:methionine synthase [Nostocoides sp. F2B08]|uniref:methionine synthase n=1 Tax=Nostocoides sp. F2B08 TaxID=2653936 RepID=UPI00126348ED|nr:methionine synthase [Tetrasphaera sp. F2B08]KAB7746114.1 methionine synthase [Tetrasphaera sp. F2B08]
MTRATGIGSWPGDDPREALVTVRDLLLDPDGLGIPYVAETPSRGPGADIVGRGAAVLTDLPVELTPSGWRLTARPGRDLERSRSFWRQDLDELAEAYDGYTGPLKISVAGPWTLAAAIELPRGERAVSDLGAAFDIAAALADGIAVLVADLGRLLPGVEPIVQVDEPTLPAVLTGTLPTASGYGRVPAVDTQQALQALTVVTGAYPETVIHCCDPVAPIPVLRQSGAGAVSLDLTAASSARWESVATTLESGTGLYAGLLPTDGSGSVRDAAARVLEEAERVGIEQSVLDAVVVTPACGLGLRSRETALAVQRAAVDLAGELNAVVGGASAGLG